jgi:hypothetical protein
MKLDNIVPFGRSFDEYQKMFRLTPDDLNCRILGVADGPASFNSELNNRGGSVISVDPIYKFSADAINEQFDSVIDGIIEQVINTPDDWVWSYHDSPESLRSMRQRATDEFIRDFRKNRSPERYITGELPILPFADSQFDLALCSHFLFLYSEHYSLEFHRRSIHELLRVADEVRIFPLLTLALDRSPYLDRVHSEFTPKGYIVETHHVEYELQKGGNEMMVIKHPVKSTM